MPKNALAEENEALKDIILNVVESLQAVLDYINDQVEIEEVDEDEEDCESCCSCDKCDKY